MRWECVEVEMDSKVAPAGGEWLSENHGSLAFGMQASPPGSISALSVTGGITLRPKEGRTLLFGRNRPDVHVCIGEDDRRVSRQHGLLTHRQGRWWVANMGRMPIRLPNSQLLFSESEQVPLATGYTPLFVRGSEHREHLLELFVVGPDGDRPVSRPGELTEKPRTWRLTADERLVLVVVGQRYLLHEAGPRPLTRQQAADQLADLQPDRGWTAKKVEHAVTEVRNRLSVAGVYGLVREEVEEPVGNSLNDNLMKELVLSTTLVPPDLALLDG